MNEYNPEETQQLSVWNMLQNAKAMQEALKMEWERADYFHELYTDIRYYGYRYNDGSDPPGQSPATDTQALEILDAKRAYDLRIIKLKEKYSRWRAFLQTIDDKTAQLLENHFELGQEVTHRDLTFLLRSASRAWESMESAREKGTEEEVREEYQEMCRKFPELRRKKSRRHPYLINGEIVQLTQMEYAMKQSREYYATK